MSHTYLIKAGTLCEAVAVDAPDRGFRHRKWHNLSRDLALTSEHIVEKVGYRFLFKLPEPVDGKAFLIVAAAVMVVDGADSSQPTHHPAGIRAFRPLLR